MLLSYWLSSSQLFATGAWRFLSTVVLFFYVTYIIEEETLLDMWDLLLSYYYLKSKSLGRIATKRGCKSESVTKTYL